MAGYPVPDPGNPVPDPGTRVWNRVPGYPGPGTRGYPGPQMGTREIHYSVRHYGLMAC